MKIAVNRCYGGFGLSYKAVMRYAELAGITLYAFSCERPATGYKYNPYDEAVSGGLGLIFYFTINNPNAVDSKKLFDYAFRDGDLTRHDPSLIQVIEELGDEASDSLAKVQIKEIPDGTDYQIDDYDGMETIHERHRSW